VKKGQRIVHGEKELREKLGRNDLCPCGSGRRFQELLPALRTLRRRTEKSLRPRVTHRFVFPTLSSFDPDQQPSRIARLVLRIGRFNRGSNPHVGS
jgi:hypothetical protein